ncbi:fungal-specific transcription factor domain-containing protein [Amanita rubescens]|nr:fungal-specific transcription factor domain-containing protein [Amanita rubescens]
MTSSSEGPQNNADAESGSGDHAQWFKKRRLQRACDLCKRKKVRCDGNQMSDSRCSNCVSHKSSCTYIEAMKRKGPLEKYVDYLENRVEKLEQLLRKLPPDNDLLKELNGSLDSSEVEINRTSADGGLLSVNALVPPTKGISLPTQRLEDGRALKEEQEDDIEYARLALAFDRVSIDYDDFGESSTRDRYYGKSSYLKLVQTAIELREEYTRKGNDAIPEPVTCNKRQEYWGFKEWEKHDTKIEAIKFQFPPDEFLPLFIDLYFEQVNLFFPLLHRPTFQCAVDEGLHYKDYWFGALLLLVCAIGSQYIDDSHVPNHGEPNTQGRGRQWFQQVQLAWQNIPGPPIIHNLQLHCLTIYYLQTTSSAQACWTMLGTAIRLAQEAGAHLKRRKDMETWTLDDELKIRAFWVLVAMDILMSSALGRPCAYRAEDPSFDLDYPLEVDDQFWLEEDPKQSPKQPLGKPSLITAFNLLLKLYQIQALTLRTIYSRIGCVGDNWKQHVITEFDSGLNKWVDSVPDYLRWDPDRENPVHFRQSVLLYTNYYYVQIQIHLPFIPSPRNSSFLSFPSLTICTKAARSCSNVVDAMRRRQIGVIFYVQLGTFTSGVTLLLSFWGAKRCGLSTDYQKEMTDIRKCIDVLGAIEKRWDSAGRLRDVLIGLSSIDDLSLRNSSPPISHKRERQDEVLDTGTQGTLAEALGKPRVIAGSQRVSRVFSHIEAQSVSAQVTASHFQQREPLHQFRPPLYDPAGYIDHQSPTSVSYLNQSLSSSTVEIAQHNHHISTQGSSWLSSTADSSNLASFFTHSNPSTPSTTQTPTLALTPTQTMDFNVPLNTETAFSSSGMQVTHNRPSAAQCRAASQAQRWDANSASLVSSFEYSDWADAGWTGGVSQFDRGHSKASQLRQDQTGSRIGSQALLSRPQPQRQLPAMQPFVPTHPQPQQLQSQRAPPLAQTRREERAQLPPGFIDPLLDPRQHQPPQLQPPPDPQHPHQPAFDQDNMQIWTSVPTMTSELANWYTY